jgi:zinc protease
MTQLLQGRLSDTIRQQLGGTYSITASPGTQKFPRPEYSVRIDWTCDPARTASLVQRVFEEIAFVKQTQLTAASMAQVRQSLVRDYEGNSTDNRYFLNQISRRYADGDAANVGAVENVPQRIAALTGADIQQASRTYLDMGNYVKVTLMPETP